MRMTKEDLMIRHPELYAEVKLEWFYKGFSACKNGAIPEGLLNPLTLFIEQCCIVDAGAETSEHLLYHHFSGWYKHQSGFYESNNMVIEIVPGHKWFHNHLRKLFELKLRIYKGISRK